MAGRSNNHEDAQLGVTPTLPATRPRATWGQLESEVMNMATGQTLLASEDRSIEDGPRTTTGARRVASMMAALVVSLFVVAGLMSPVQAGNPTPEIWIGSPLSNSTWPNNDGCPASYPSYNCSQPYAHHTYKYGDPYVGDVGWDMQNVPYNAPVKVYAAPQDTRYNNSVVATVARVLPACATRSGESYSQTIARGGYAVVVQFSINGTQVGTVKYVHLGSVSVRGGQTISRWGAQIGTVGTFPSNSCNTGRHLHMELMNFSKYACATRGFAPGQAVRETNFVGFIGGWRVSGPQQSCP